MKNLHCPICHEELFSQAGKGCKMCGMPLEDEGKEFCCKDCRIKYMEIYPLRVIQINRRKR